MTDVELGNQIREARKKRGLTQSELARRIGVTWEMVSRYERGRSSALLKLLDIARALDVEVNTFFGSSIGRHFNEPGVEYLSDRFIPVLNSVPASRQELERVISESEFGVRIHDDGIAAKFGIKLGNDSKIRIATSSLLPKGLVICTLELGDLTEHSVVLTTKAGLISIEQYSQKMNVLAKVVEWIVKMP